MPGVRELPQLQALQRRRHLRCLQVEKGRTGVGLLLRSGVPMMRAAMLCCLMLPATAAAAEPHTFTGKAVSVQDGDTLHVLDDAKHEHTIRLDGIDAPERKQAFGTVARDRLAEITKGKPVTVQAGKRDKYGRTVARIEVEGQDVNRQMVVEGLAWHYTRYSDDATLAEAEGEARAAGRGLWADREPVPPWEWRATEKERRRKPARR
jgi:endonuclease YncB( thermonuclease family)